MCVSIFLNFIGGKTWVCYVFYCAQCFWKCNKAQTPILSSSNGNNKYFAFYLSEWIAAIMLQWSNLLFQLFVTCDNNIFNKFAWVLGLMPTWIYHQIQYHTAANENIDSHTQIVCLSIRNIDSMGRFRDYYFPCLCMYACLR